MSPAGVDTKRMIAVSLLAALAFMAPAAHASQEPLLTPGTYRSTAGHLLYVGPERFPPRASYSEYFDTATQHLGRAEDAGRLTAVATIQQQPIVIAVKGEPLGASIWFAGRKPRPTIVLIHGNDNETREMGFLVPYFVLHGLTVVTYDQRGTGESAGDWQANGPAQRADDVVALIAAARAYPQVDVRRVGLWAFSNGGWTAPIVATKTPIAFMILKSAPAQTEIENIEFEIRQRMLGHRFSARQVADAISAFRSLVGALNGIVSWDRAKQAYQAAKAAPWFDDAALPPDLAIPPSAEVAAGYRRAITYDPAPTLRHVRTPTLALFGALDRSVDARASLAVFRASFAAAGMRDFSAHVFPNAGHVFDVSRSGFNGDSSLPRRLPRDYPQIMIDWLKARGRHASITS